MQTWLANLWLGSLQRAWGEWQMKLGVPLKHTFLLLFRIPSKEFIECFFLASRKNKVAKPSLYKAQIVRWSDFWHPGGSWILSKLSCFDVAFLNLVIYGLELKISKKCFKSRTWLLRPLDWGLFVWSLPATFPRCVSRSLPQWCLHHLCTNARDQWINPRDRRFLGLLALQWSEGKTDVYDRCVFIAGRSSRDHHMGAMRTLQDLKNNIIYK